MSHIMYLYEVEHQDINNVVSSGSNSEIFSQIVANKSDEEVRGLRRLFDQSYSRHPDSLESEDAAELIIALQHVCIYLTNGKAVSFEFTLDEDIAPELFDFPFDDWDEDDFGMPISADGVPAVIYRNNKSLVDYHHKFQAVLTEERYDEDSIDEDDLRELVGLLARATAHRRGVCIFCFE